MPFAIAWLLCRQLGGGSGFQTVPLADVNCVNSRFTVKIKSFSPAPSRQHASLSQPRVTMSSNFIVAVAVAEVKTLVWVGGVSECGIWLVLGVLFCFVCLLFSVFVCCFVSESLADSDQRRRRHCLCRELRTIVLCSRNCLPAAGACRMNDGVCSDCSDGGLTCSVLTALVVL